MIKISKIYLKLRLLDFLLYHVQGAGTHVLLNP